MKRLFILLATSVLAVLPAPAATFYKATVTVTSVPPANAAISAPGDSRGWQTAASITNAQRQIATTNTLQAAATNLFQHLSLYGFTNVNGVKLGTNGTAVPTNTVVLEMAVDQFVTLTTLSNWATITYATNTASSMVAVRVPHTSESGLVQTQVVTGLINALADSRATNKVTNTSPAFSAFITTRTNVQYVTNLVTRGGSNFNGVLSGVSGQLSNVGVVNLTVTNFASPSTGTVSLAMGDASVAGDYAIAIGDGTDAGGPYSVVIGIANSGTSGEGAVAIGNQTTPTGYASVTVGTDAGATTNYATAIGYGASALHLNSTAIGESALTTASNQVRLGVSYDTVSVPGNFDLLGTGFVAQVTVTNLDVKAGTLTNVGIAASGITATSATVVTLYATNGRIENMKLITAENYQHLTNSGAILHRETTVSSLAAGNNVIDRGTNNFVHFSATAGAATICAITNGFGSGDWFHAVNGTGYELTIVNQSGFTTIPANRILTVNGASNVTVYPGGLMSFRYSTNDTRWRLVYPEVFNAVATNAIASVDGVGTNTFLIAPVLATSGSATNTTNGWVWTASGTNGAGAWAAASAGGTNYVGQLNGIGTNLAATYFTGTTNDPFQVQASNAAPVLVVKTNGFTGIKTNAPAYELQVAGTNAATAFIATKTGSGSAPAYQFSDGRGFFQDGTGGGGGIGVSPGGTTRIGLGNVGIEMGSGLYIGWASAGSPANAPDIFFYRHGAKTNGVSGVSGTSTPTGTTLASNYIAHGISSFKAINFTNTPPAGHAALCAVTNSGTVELIVIDSAGNVTQISPHAMDSPGLAADNSPLPMIIRHRNEYAGVEEWIHLSKLARAVEQLTGQRLVYTNAVTKRDWKSDQDAEQASWNAARQAEIQARNDGDTNVTVRPVRDVRQSTPDWLRNRGQR